MVESLFARDFGHKLNFKVRHSKAIIFYDPEWTRPKDIFLIRLHVAVFYESGTDRKRRVPPIDPCYSRQKRRRRDPLTGGHFLSALAANGISIRMHEFPRVIPSFFFPPEQMDVEAERDLRETAVDGMMG